MDLAIGLGGCIEMGHYRNGELLSWRRIRNTTTEACATTIADGLSDGNCNAVTHMRLQLTQYGGGNSGSNTQRPFAATGDSSVATTGLGAAITGIGSYACKSVTSFGITSTQIGSNYNQVSSMDLGYGSSVSDLSPYATHTLTGGDIIVVEDGDTVEVTWYIGGNDGVGAEVSQCISNLLVGGSDSGSQRPMKLGYQTSSSDRIYVSVASTTTGSGSVGGTSYKFASYTSPSFTGGDSATPARPSGNAYGLFAKSNNTFYADGGNEAGASYLFSIVNGTNYVLNGKIKVTWG